MEIERKFLIEKEALPDHLEEYPHNRLEQAYIITNPVLRVRQKDDQYILTYKGEGLMAYEKLLAKSEGNIITKTRYKIPESNGLTIELDIFHGMFEGLFLAEVEFADEQSALSYEPPVWFGKEVTNTSTFHNSTLSQMNPMDAARLIESL